jgi:hypothetical protein
MPVKDAKQATIELSKLNWELIDLTYRFEWDDPAWVADNGGQSAEVTAKRKDTVEQWSKRRSEYLASICRRIKYEALMDRVIAKDHLGRVPFKIVYDMEPVAGLDVNYRVLSTNPEGEVRVNEETTLNLKESDKSW